MTLIICGFVLIGYGTWYVLDYVLAKEDLESVAKERDRLHEDLERAKKLHENLEVEITKSYANEVNELAKKVEGKEPAMELIPHYAMIIDAYNKLTEKQKEYVTFNIKDIKYNVRKSLEIKKFYDRVTNIDNYDI